MNGDKRAGSNPAKQKKGSGALTVFAVIGMLVLMCAVSYTVTSFYNNKNFQLDFRANVALVDTSSLIQEYQMKVFQGMNPAAQDSKLPLFKDYLDTMQHIVNAIQEEYNVILLERGAMPAGGFYDYTDVLEKELIAQGYTFLKEE